MTWPSQYDKKWWKCGKGEGTCEKRCFYTVVQQSKYGLGCLTVVVPRSHTHTQLSPAQVISTQAATYTTLQTQETNIHALNGICTHDSSNKAATDLHLRLCSRMDQSRLIFLEIRIMGGGDMHKRTSKTDFNNTSEHEKTVCHNGPNKYEWQSTRLQLKNNKPMLNTSPSMWLFLFTEL
jgi:hypothetical protein